MKRARLLIWATIWILAGTGYAQAADSEHRHATFFAALLVLILVGRLLGEAMGRLGQTSIVGPLLAGMLLGPSFLGWLWPDLQQAIFPSTLEQTQMIDAISQVGVLLLLLLTGMETDLRLIRQVGKAAISISISGVAVPFLCGVALGWFLPESLLPDPGKRLLTGLFLGTALSISSIKIVAAVIHEMNFTRRNLGQVILASAVLEDTIGWIVIAIIFGIAGSQQLDAAHIAKTIGGVLVFMVASFTVGRTLIPLLIRWSNDYFKSDFAVISTILVIMFGMALITNAIGVHFVLGAFVTGVLVGESPILTKYIKEQLQGLIVAFFMPVFFAVAGLSADFTIFRDPSLLLMTLALIGIASIGKFLGAFVGAEIGGLSRREALALGCGMNARGATEVIVATIGLSMGALSQNLYTMIVAMALTTTIAMPPMLRWALNSVPLGKEEKERLEREEFEAKGFVSNLERLLLAVDQSTNGKLASRIAGILAGRRGMPVTVVKLSSLSARARVDDKPKEVEAPETTVKEAAETAGQSEPPAATKVDVTVKEPNTLRAEQAIIGEAKNGYDLLIVGVDDKKTKADSFPVKASRALEAFEATTAIVIARSKLAEAPLATRFKILVPITGTKFSRQAAELAFSIAQGQVVTTLSVGSPSRSRWRRLRENPERQAMVKDIVELAGRFDANVKTVIRSKTLPEEGILEAISKGGFNLVILGVSRRPGKGLYFGDIAAALLEHSPASLVFLSTD